MSVDSAGSALGAGDAVPGVDVGAVTDWLVERLAELEAPLTFTRVGEGQSNMTFRFVDAAGHELVLRRPPLGAILPSAHDMTREHRILTGLASVSGLVPRTRALCEDLDVIGATFYVMEYVDGLILTRVETAERLPPAARRATARSLARTLNTLQSVDLDAIGLGDFKRPESLISRQLRRWTRQWHASKTRELPLIDELARRFTELMPAERESVLVHGDYRLDNVVLAPDGLVRAVLDWELCTVGDPLADVGSMIAYWDELGAAAKLPDGMFKEPVTDVPGFPPAEDLATEYARASGRDLTHLGFWVAFAYWKVAIIVEGVYRRWLNDPANGSGAGVLGPSVPRLAENALKAIDRTDWTA